MREAYCPKCFGELAQFRRGGIVTLRCTGCQGHWVDSLSVGKALEGAGSLQESRAVQTLLASIMGEKTDLGCPQCEEARLLRSYIDRVEIEFCPDCRGLFLDPGEMQRLKGAHQPDPRAGVQDASAETGGEWGLVVDGLILVAEILFT